MNTELDTVAASVRGAKLYTEVFGTCIGDVNQLKGVYRKLAMVLHPDRYQDEVAKQLAQDVFAVLNGHYEEAMTAFDKGTYGKPLVLAKVRTRRYAHEINSELCNGDIAALYLASSQGEDGKKIATVVKIARSSKDMDLVKNESSVSKLLHGQSADPKFSPFFSKVIDSFAYQEVKKPKRQANVIEILDGFYGLDEVIRSFPAGINQLDMIWIYRRLLYALGELHRMKIIHGAVLPVHIMVHPEKHGLVLADWCYASIHDDALFPPIKAIAKPYIDWYPNEVLMKESPSPATDIVMANRSMIALLGGDIKTGMLPTTVHRKLHGYFKGCLSERKIARPDDAWSLLLEFDELLKTMGAPFYPRRFHTFSMPSGSRNAH